jgi:hypothetical protein
VDSVLILDSFNCRRRNEEVPSKSRGRKPTHNWRRGKAGSSMSCMTRSKHRVFHASVVSFFNQYLCPRDGIPSWNRKKGITRMTRDLPC